MDVEAKLLEEDYIWRWTTRVMPLEGSKASPLRFEQSTIGGAVLSPEHLHRIAADYIPQLSEEGLRPRRTFELMDGRASLEENRTQTDGRVPQALLKYAGSIVVRRCGFATIEPIGCAPAGSRLAPEPLAPRHLQRSRGGKRQQCQINDASSVAPIALVNARATRETLRRCGGLVLAEVHVDRGASFGLRVNLT
jgi:hypothetical protein